MAEVLVVVVAYRSDEVLPNLVHSLPAATNRTFRVAVVDNFRSTDTELLVQDLDSCAEFDVQYVRSLGNVGYAAAVNHGIRLRANERFVLVVNPDAQMDPGSLDRLVEELEAHPRCAIVGPGIADQRGRQLYAYYRFPTVFAQTLAFFHLHPYSMLSPWTGRTRRPAVSTPVDWVSGACMLLRVEDLAELGPMDERYFMYMEDVDWCAQARSMGRTVRWVGDANVRHIGGFSASQNSPRAYAQARLAKLIYARKWRGKVETLRLGLILLLEAVAKLVISLVSRRQDQFWRGPALFLRLVAYSFRGSLTKAQFRALADNGNQTK